MEPQFLVFGQLTREYLLPPDGPPRMDMPGGGLLHAAAGLRIWESEIGLVGRVGNDYPRDWLNLCIERGRRVPRMARGQGAARRRRPGALGEHARCLRKPTCILALPSRAS